MSLSEAFVQSLWPGEWNFVSRTQMWFSSTQNICYCTWQRQQPKDTFNFKHIFYWTWQRQQPKDTLILNTFVYFLQRKIFTKIDTETFSVGVLDICLSVQKTFQTRTILNLTYRLTQCILRATDYYTIFDPTNCKTIINKHLSLMFLLHVSTSTSSSSERYI